MSEIAPEDQARKFCPACDRVYAGDTVGEADAKLKEHLKKAEVEGDENHIKIIELEGWREDDTEG